MQTFAEQEQRYLEQVWQVLAHLTDRAWRRERRICCDMNAFLLAPVNHSLVSEVTVYLHLYTTYLLFVLDTQCLFACHNPGMILQPNSVLFTDYCLYFCA